MEVAKQSPPFFLGRKKPEWSGGSEWSDYSEDSDYSDYSENSDDLEDSEDLGGGTCSSPPRDTSKGLEEQVARRQSSGAWVVINVSFFLHRIELIFLDFIFAWKDFCPEVEFRVYLFGNVLDFL